MIWRNFFRFFLLIAATLPAMAQAVESVPSDRVGEVMAGEFAFQSGLYVEAAQHYLQAAQTSPDAGLAERAAHLAVLAGDDQLLARALLRWQQLQPDSSVRAGMALRRNLSGNQALAARIEAETLLGQGSEGLKILRDSFDQARGSNAALARQLLREMIAGDRLPAVLDTWLALASLAWQLGENASAQHLLERAPDKFPTEPQALLALAVWQREQGDSTAALATLAERNPAQVPEDADRRRFVTEYMLNQDFARAERWLAAIDQDAATYRQRLALLSRSKDADALAALSVQVKLDRGMNPARRELLLGLAAELVPDWREAERHYADVRNGPDYVESRFRLVFVLQQQGRDSDALRQVRKIQHDPDGNADARRDAFALEAQVLKSAPGDADIEAYARGLLLFKDDAKLLYGRAMRYLEKDQVDAGLADLRRILDAEPEHVAALNAYGYTLAESKQEYSTALPLVEHALRLQPVAPAGHAAIVGDRIVPVADLVHMAAGGQARAGWHTDRAGRPGIGETRAARRHPVEVRCSNEGMTRAAHVARVVLIGEDE